MSRPVEATFHVAIDDLVHVARHVSRASLGFLLASVALIGLIVAAAEATAPGSITDRLSEGHIVLLLIVSAGVLGWLTLWGPRRAAAQTFRKAQALGEVTMRLDEEGLHVKNAEGHALYPWEVVDRAVETKTQILFYLSRTIALGLPKRHLTPADLEAARALLRERARLR